MSSARVRQMRGPPAAAGSPGCVCCLPAAAAACTRHMPLCRRRSASGCCPRCRPPPTRRQPGPPPAAPGQLRNLERALGDAVRLCDRTALILDIFSQRAATREGKLQVAPGGRVASCPARGVGAAAGRSGWLGAGGALRVLPGPPPASRPLRHPTCHTPGPSSRPHRWSWLRASTSCRASLACGPTWSARAVRARCAALWCFVWLAGRRCARALPSLWGCCVGLTP